MYFPDLFGGTETLHFVVWSTDNKTPIMPGRIIMIMRETFQRKTQGINYL